MFKEMTMFTVDTSIIAEEVRKAIVEISRNIEPTCLAALERARDEEKVPAARFALTKMCESARFAAQMGYPVCQDTGMCVVFVEIGKDAVLTGKLLQDAIDGAVREGYADLRKSVLDPVTRVNTGTNTPAVIHTDFVPGDEVKVSVMLKGFGSENMSALYMLNPAQGLDTAKDLIVETVARAASTWARRASAARRPRSAYSFASTRPTSRRCPSRSTFCAIAAAQR